LTYCNHAAVSDETARHIAAQSPSDKNRANSSPAPGVSVVVAAVGSDWDRPVCRLRGSARLWNS